MNQQIANFIPCKVIEILIVVAVSYICFVVLNCQLRGVCRVVVPGFSARALHRRYGWRPFQ